MGLFRVIARKLVPPFLKAVYWRVTYRTRKSYRQSYLGTITRRVLAGPKLAHKALPWQYSATTNEDGPSSGPDKMHGSASLRVFEDMASTDALHSRASLSLSIAVVREYACEARRRGLPWRIQVESAGGVSLEGYAVRPVLVLAIAQAVCLYAEHRCKRPPHCRLTLAQQGGKACLTLLYGMTCATDDAAHAGQEGVLPALLGYVRDLLAQDAREGLALERFVCDRSGSAGFRLHIPPAGVLGSWERFERGVANGATLLSACPRARGHNRVYLRDGAVIKAGDGVLATGKSRSVHGEHALLARLEGIPGIPQVLGAGTECGIDWFSRQYIGGRALDEWVATPGKKRLWPRLMAELGHIARCANERGVVYFDWLQEDNIVIDELDRPWLIDFDCAYLRTSGEHQWPDLAAGGRFLERQPALDVLWNVRGWASERRRAATRLARAWRIAGGRDAPYSLSFGSTHLAGRRPWFEVWAPVRDSLLAELGGLEGRRILEIGCGLALASSHLADAGVDCLAMDCHAGALKAANGVATAYGAPVTFRCCDLCDNRQSPCLIGDYDAVLLLAPQRQLADMPRLLEFLASQRLVVFGGSLSEEENAAIGQSCGFDSMRILCQPPGDRPLVLAKKTGDQASGTRAQDGAS